MKICPTCHSCYDDTASSCSKDHAALVMERTGTRLLVGKYWLECLLGRGDKGNAYEATDRELNSPVIAVELHGTKVIDDPHEMKRFHREARQVVRAGGQDVADIYDYGLLPHGGAYVVMERIERDVQREGLIAKSPLTASPTIEGSVTLPNNYGQPSGETFRVQAEASTAENTEEETLTSPQHTRAASDAVARLAEKEIHTFPAPETVSHRVVKDNAATFHKAITSPEHSLASPALPPVMRTPALTNSDQSAPLPLPIVVKVPEGGSGRNGHRSLVYVGLAAALAVTSAAMWFTFNRERSPLPNIPVASIASPTAETPTTSLTTPDSRATESVLSASTAPASPVTIADNPPPVMKTRRRAAKVRPKSPHVILGQTLDDWIAATAERDVERQMSFYMPVLTTFYRRNDVPQDFVREEKARLFADPQTVDMRLLSKPQITFSEGGRVATMRILLSGITQDGGQKRFARVMRELRWRKTNEGWKIFSERDL